MYIIYIYIYIYVYVYYLYCLPPPIARGPTSWLEDPPPRPPLVSDVLWHKKSCSCYGMRGPVRL